MALTKREAEGDFQCVLRDVPITGTFYSANYDSQIDAGWDPMKDSKCLLVRDKTNSHDRFAVQVHKWGRNQIGWVGQKTGHSQKVAELLDACEKAGAYILITRYDRHNTDSNRLRGDVYLPVVPKAEPEPPAKLTGPIARRIYANNSRTEERADLKPYAGKLLTIDTGLQRVSVTLRTGDGTQVSWFRKVDFDKENSNSFDLDKASKAGYFALVITYNSVMLISPKQAQEFGYKMASPLTAQQAVGKLGEAGLLTGYGRVVTDEFGTRSVEYPHTVKYEFEKQFEREPDEVVGDELIYNVTKEEFLKMATPAATQTQPPKETIMSKIAQTATQIINTNKSAAATAGYMEAGRLANNQASKLASKHLPMMLRGYADTPLGKLVIANIAQAAVKQLRPNDVTLNELTEAMIVQAFQALYQTVDLDGILDSLTSSPEMTRAVGKLKAGRVTAEDDGQ